MDLSLGELICLLCDEVGNAALKTHQDQFEKIKQAQDAASLDLRTFAAQNLTEEDVSQHSVKLWGVDIFDSQIKVRELMEIVASSTHGPLEFSFNRKLRESALVSQLNEVRQSTILNLAEERQSLAKTVIARNELPRIHIDSGEVTVRIGLNLAERQRAEDRNPHFRELLSETGLRVVKATAETAPPFAAPNPKGSVHKAYLVAKLLQPEDPNNDREATVTIKFKVV